jgi:hypothetical protein
MKPSFPVNGWIRLSRAKGALTDSKFGDGEGFADFIPGKWAFELTGFEGMFPDGRILEDETKP